MAKTFTLEILTPKGRYFKEDVEFLNVRSEDYNLGILPDHDSLVSTLAISMMQIRKNGHDDIYSISGGIIRVKNNLVTLLLNSVERQDEIDINRANASKDRALNRLENKSSQNIDVKRAELSLKRALNRLNVSNYNK